MPSYRLHYFPESGNSYKLALMLTLCGETFEPVWTDFGGGITRTAEWRKAVNEMGEIPVLEVDGVKMTQTAPLLLKLSEQYGRFGAETADEKFELLRWLFWDNHKLTGYMATYRFMRAFTQNNDPQVLKHFHAAARRLPRHSRGPSPAQCLRDRHQADGRRYLDDGLSALSERRARLRFRGKPSRHPRLARPHGGAARLEACV